MHLPSLHVETIAKPNFRNEEEIEYYFSDDEDEAAEISVVATFPMASTADEMLKLDSKELQRVAEESLQGDQDWELGSVIRTHVIPRTKQGDPPIRRVIFRLLHKRSQRIEDARIAKWTRKLRELKNLAKSRRMRAEKTFSGSGDSSQTMIEEVINNYLKRVPTTIKEF